MKEIQYKKFSWDTHKKNLKLESPSVCQFELTFRCGLNCNYCYAICYNKPEYVQKELDTEQVKFILDKVHKEGTLWLCFTGGDPLERGDFLDIYSYAKDKGFIISIFTNGYSMTEEIVDYLRKNPPFVIEVTLNAATRKTYEKISGINGSFEKTMKGIDLILQGGLSLKIKTQVIKDNLEELPKIKNFIEGLGLEFRPSSFLHARLDKDSSPCGLRISPEEVLNLNGKKLPNNDCKVLPKTEKLQPTIELFSCAIGGGDGINIDPYGNLTPCNCLREPKADLLKEDFEEARNVILGWARSRRYITNSKCRDCLIREICYNCPGKAFLEMGNLEGQLDWFCELANQGLARNALHMKGI
ncbi:radical SAM protein [Candidatus Omnitrophota bacterium]